MDRYVSYGPFSRFLLKRPRDWLMNFLEFSPTKDFSDTVQNECQMRRDNLDGREQGENRHSNAVFLMWKPRQVQCLQTLTELPRLLRPRTVTWPALYIKWNRILRFPYADYTSCRFFYFIRKIFISITSATFLHFFFRSFIIKRIVLRDTSPTLCPICVSKPALPNFQCLTNFPLPNWYTLLARNLLLYSSQQ